MVVSGSQSFQLSDALKVGLLLGQPGLFPTHPLELLHVELGLEIAQQSHHCVCFLLQVVQLPELELVFLDV